MATTPFTQDDRLLKIHTPLGPDVLLVVGFSGQEAISSMFRFHLDLIAENQNTIAFDKLLGQKVSIELQLPDANSRFFHGILCSFSQGGRNLRFTRYAAELVPEFWLLTRTVRSRIFQQMSVKDILSEVLASLKLTWETQGTFEPRDYCVQYRESDFQFASRLMEEEGIYYFFKHTDDSEEMVLANSPQSHPEISDPSKLIYDEVEGGTRNEERIISWEKSQDLRSGKYTLWDHCFELPGKHLEAEKTILETAQAGKVVHKLKVGGNDAFEIYDYPGAYAQRFDGVTPGGGDRSSDLQKIFDDNTRTVGIRMQQEALPGLVVNAASKCGHLVSGHKFTLTRHFNADGPYVITSMSHTGQEEYGTGVENQMGERSYSNTFTCIPFALPFRPLRVTPRPFVHGSHTATVVGPAGEEIFTDKYSRVKVQFQWDREGQNDANSSCWVRVGTPWAGQQWGMIHIPRIGQEVIVDFLEGDPDQPIIVGSVYNAAQMPPYKLPDNKTQSGIRSNSSIGGGQNDRNEMRFEDKMGSEQFFMYAQNDMDQRVKHDSREFVGNDRSLIVTSNQKESVGADKHGAVSGNQMEKVGGAFSLQVGGALNEQVGGDLSLQVTGNQWEKVGQVYSCEATQEIHLKAGMKVIIEAPEVSLIGMGGFVDVGPAGVTIQGTMVLINSGGAAGVGTPCSPNSPTNPQAPDVADDGSKVGKLN